MPVCMFTSSKSRPDTSIPPAQPCMPSFRTISLPRHRGRRRSPRRPWMPITPTCELLLRPPTSPSFATADDRRRPLTTIPNNAPTSRTNSLPEHHLATTIRHPEPNPPPLIGVSSFTSYRVDDRPYPSMYPAISSKPDGDAIKTSITPSPASFFFRCHDTPSSPVPMSISPTPSLHLLCVVVGVLVGV